MHLGGPVTRRTERGATLVEFALLLPILMMLILGMFTGGHAYFQKISVTDAVREGARYGATLVVEGSATDWEDKVRAKVAASSGGELDTTDVCAKLHTVTTTADNLCGVDDPPGSVGQQVVKVSGERSARIEWLVGSMDVTLRGEAAALYERTDG